MNEEKKLFLKDLILITGKMKVYRYLNHFFYLLLSAINAISTFIFPFANTLFQNGNETLGIVVLCVGMFKSTIYQCMEMLRQVISLDYENHVEILAAKKASSVLTIVRNKVYQEDEKTGKSILSEPVEVMSNVAEYIEEKISVQDKIVKVVLEAVMFGITIVGAVMVTAKSASNLTLVIVALTICFLIIIYISIRQVQRRKEYFSKERQRINKLNVHKEDVLNIIPINLKHSNFLINNFVSSKKVSTIEQRKLNIKETIESSLKNFIMGATTTILVIVALYNYESIDATIFATVIALAVMYSSLVRTLSEEIQEVQRVINSYTEYESYIPIIQNIADVYLEQKRNKVKTDINEINEIHLFDFCFEYKNDDEKRHKIYTADLKLTKGKINLFYGKSGSGKSTFFKILTGCITNPNKNICINNNLYVNFIENSVLYDPKSQLGKNSILEEITFSNDVNIVDKNKLLEILKGLELYEDFKSKNEDVIGFLSNSRKDVFSDGQLRRLILARMLYNIEDTNNVLVFDEPTEHLDYYTGKKVIEFISWYCNKQKERLLIISSHQLDIVDKYCENRFEFKKKDVNFFVIEKS